MKIQSRHEDPKDLRPKEKPEVRPNIRADLRLLLCKASENIKRKLELDKMGGGI